MEWYKNSRHIRIDITRICVEFAYHRLKEWCVAFAYPFAWAELKHHSAIRLRVPSKHYSGRLCRSWALKVLELVHETGLMSLTMMNGSYIVYNDPWYQDVSAKWPYRCDYSAFPSAPWDDVDHVQQQFDGWLKYVALNGYYRNINHGDQLAFHWLIAWLISNQLIVNDCESTNQWY